MKATVRGVFTAFVLGSLAACAASGTAEQGTDTKEAASAPERVEFFQL